MSEARREPSRHALPTARVTPCTVEKGSAKQIPLATPLPTPASSRTHARTSAKSNASHSLRVRPRAAIGELERSAWHARGDSTTTSLGGPGGPCGNSVRRIGWPNSYRRVELEFRFRGRGFVLRLVETFETSEPISSAASRSVASTKWLYTWSVIEALECPSRPATVRTETPEDISRVAAK